MSEDGSGDQHIATSDIFHYLQLILLIVLCIVVFAGGIFVLANKNAPIPEQLVEDILVEHVQTCFAPLHQELQVPLLGYIDEQKLTSQGLMSCIEQGTDNFVGIRLTHRVSGEVTEVIYPGSRAVVASEKIPVLLLRTTEEQEPVFLEVLFS